MEQPDGTQTVSAVVRLVRKSTRFLALAMLLMLLPIVLVMLWDWWGAYRTLDWPAVKGRIVEGGYHAPRGQDQDLAVVEYEVDGKKYRHVVKYRSDEEELGIERLDHVRRFAHGAAVDVYYDPEEAPDPLDATSRLYVRYHTVLLPGFAPDAFDGVFVLVGFLAAIAIFWYVPSWLIGKAEHRFQQALNDPNREVITVEAKTATGTYRHTEIRDKRDIEQEPFVREDEFGRVKLDSTQRPLRLMFGGFFLVVGWLIGAFMFLASDDLGAFEYFFVGGWTAFALAAMGLVYEVTLNKREGTIAKEYGWFFVLRRRRYRISDFDRVVVETTFYRNAGTSSRAGAADRETKFSVELSGNERVNLMVLPRLSDAQRLAREIAEYLALPLASDSNVRI